MFLKATALSLGLFFALQPLAHATNDELLKKVANHAIEKACFEISKGSASLQKAILETAEENVKWLSVVSAMSPELRVQLASNLSTSDGFETFKDYLIAHTESLDHPPTELDALLENVELHLITLRRNSNKRLSYELTEWKNELKRYFDISSVQENAESLDRKRFQYVQAAVRIAATAFVTLPKANRKSLEKKIFELNPTRENSAAVGTVIGVVAGGLASALVPRVSIFTWMLLGGYLGTKIGKGIGDKMWLSAFTAPLLTTAQLQSYGGLLLQPNQTLNLTSVLSESSFPDRLASGSVSLIDAAQIGAWELAVLESETRAAKETSGALALKIRIYTLELMDLAYKVHDAVRQDHDFGQLDVVGTLLDAIATRDKRAQTLLVDVINRMNPEVNQEEFLLELEQAATQEMKRREGIAGIKP